MRLAFQALQKKQILRAFNLRCKNRVPRRAGPAVHELFGDREKPSATAEQKQSKSLGSWRGFATPSACFAFAPDDAPYGARA